MRIIIEGSDGDLAAREESSLLEVGRKAPSYNSDIERLVFDGGTL